MEHQFSQSGKPLDDDDKVIPLRCYGRGWKLIPLDELPIFQYLKRHVALKGVTVAGERGRPPEKHSHPSSYDSSDADHNKYIGKSGCSRQTPLRATALSAGLEPMQAAQERGEVLRQPSTSQRSPGPQSSHLAYRHRYIAHTSGPPTSCHHQTDRPSRHSIQPSPATTKQCHLEPPVKSLPKGPSGSDCHGGARRKMPTKSRNRGHGASRSARKARRPAKKASFDPNTFKLPVDLSAWAESFTKGVSRDSIDDSDDDLTVCRDAEDRHYGTLMFPPDSENELTDCNEDEAKQHVSSEDSIYESLSSMSLESTTDLMYETAAEMTPENCSPVPEPKTAPLMGISKSLEAKSSSQALTAESVYNSIVSSANARATEIAPEYSNPSPKQIKTGLPARTSNVPDTECTPKAVTAEFIHNSIVSSRAEIYVQEILLSSTAASESKKTDFKTGAYRFSKTRRIRKAMASEFVYNSTISSAAGTVAGGNYVSSTSVPEPTKIRFRTAASKQLMPKCSLKSTTSHSVYSSVVSSATGKAEEVTPRSSTRVSGLPSAGCQTGISKVLDSKHFSQTETVESVHDSIVSSVAGVMATEGTPVTSATVLELPNMRASIGTSEVLDIKHIPRAASAESVNNNVISSAANAATKLQNPPVISAAVLELPHTGISASSSMVWHSMHTPQTTIVESVNNGIISTASEKAAGVTFGSSTSIPEPAKTSFLTGTTSEFMETKQIPKPMTVESAKSDTSCATGMIAELIPACSSPVSAKTDLPAATSITLKIKGLPEGTTAESLYEIISSFAPVDDVSVTAGDEVCGKVIVTKCCNVAWLMKCLREALALEGKCSLHLH
ncbi:uncharacterized protein LOC142566079 isoform X2 [Dermacentor variabilis]|uniref:uncharacterized protein LOC142566079 isoform X2 n=1 Tax=Dermacentor variabilis TaxID=34621 RepID=UPI003F5BEC67